MKTLVEIFADYAKTQPEVCFAADSFGTSYSYKEARQSVLHVTKQLKYKWKIDKGDRVLVKCNQSVEYLIVCLACNMAGAIFIPIEGNASEERICGIAEETECKLYISASKVSTFTKVTTYQELVSGILSDSGGHFSSTVFIATEYPDIDDVSEILYTTGTTGKSKGIVLTHRMNIALAENIKYGVNMRPGNVELIPLVMSHSHGLRTFYANLLNGGSVVITDGVMNVKAVFSLMEKYNVTSLDLSPSATQVLIKLSKGVFWEKAKHLDYIEIGTAALPETLKGELVKNLPGVHLYNFYGSTESGRTCVLDFSVDLGKQKCIGKPSKNANIIFTDDDRKPIQSSQESPGLLASGGAMNMTCYYKNPELTKEVLVNGFVCTNDLGYYDEEGYVYVVGRRDDVINYNGIKISPIEIEDVVCVHPNVAEAACVGKADLLAGQIPKLFIVIKDVSAFDMEQFKAYLSAHLDGTKMPKEIEQLDALPRTYNGKLDRKELAKL